MIDYLRINNHSFSYSEAVTVPVTQQVISSMAVILGEDGSQDGVKRISDLAENSKYFSTSLRQMGFIVYGDEGSPVIPLLLFNPAKIRYDLLL